MGVEIKVNDLSKSFGKQLIWGDVTLTVPAGEICVMLGPSGTGKSVFLKTLIGLLKPDKGSILIEGTDIASCSERDLYEIRKLFGVLFQDGAMFGSMNLYDNVAFPLREHTQEVRVRGARDRHGEDGPRRPPRRRGQAPGRDLRRHAQARRPRPRAGARPRDRALRRARLRPRPGAHRVPQPADRRPQRPDRRHLPHRDPRHQHRADGAGQHRPALPPPPRHVRPPRAAAQLRGAGGAPVPQRPEASARSACRRRRTPTSSPPRPARSCRRCRRSRCSSTRPTASRGAASALPGEWCREHGVTPPPGSFESSNAGLAPGA